MKKYLLILLILVSSCATRKVDVVKIDVKKDSVAETKTIVTSIETKEKTDSTNMVTTIDNSEITITPIDSSKTIMVDGKSYKNVVLRIKKNKVNTLYTNNKTESNTKRNDSLSATIVHKKETTTSKAKVIDKEANYWFILYWLILALIIYMVWRNKKYFLTLL